MFGVRVCVLVLGRTTRHAELPPWDSLYVRGGGGVWLVVLVGGFAVRRRFWRTRCLTCYTRDCCSCCRSRMRFEYMFMHAHSLAASLCVYPLCCYSSILRANWMWCECIAEGTANREAGIVRVVICCQQSQFARCARLILRENVCDKVKCNCVKTIKNI